VGFIADLHIHSKHSRATSRDCDLEHLAWWAGRKGITVVGTGDFTHPGWFEELRTKLVPDGDTGLFRLRDDLDRERLRTLPGSCRGPVRFMLSVEISTIYKKADRTRKIHHLIYAPDLETAARFNRALGKIGNLHSDGRPILGLDSRHLLEIALESGPGAYLVPAHIWTPWFAVLGAMSGFDAVADCYGDLAEHVFAVETGLSSDPPMNWRVSSLDRYTLVSNSDAHSPPILGREASAFACEVDYFAMRRALETRTGYDGTVEFFPEEGKYHLDGHRKCETRFLPAETRKLGGACPECGKRVTEGVLSRVETLADRDEGEQPAQVAPFTNLVPLPEIVGEIVGVGAKSKSVEREVAGLVERLGPELEILRTIPPEDIRRAGSELLGESISRLRRGEVRREAGYDGKYGVIRMFEERELRGRPVVESLFYEAEPPAETSTETPATLAASVSAADARVKGSRQRSAERDAGLPLDLFGTPVTATPERTDFRGTGTPAAAPRRTAARRVAELLSALDPEQRSAAEIVHGPLLVVAGPGSGKTRTCTYRIANLLLAHGVAAERCVAVTFTRRAAAEMQARLEALLGRKARGAVVTTLHGLGLRILTEQRVAVGLQRGFRVADEAERVALAREVFGVGERRARSLLSQISRARRVGESRGARPREAAPVTEASVLTGAYREALWERDLVDFDDLVEIPASLLESDLTLRDAYRERFAWLSVDEYQDVDDLQYRLIRTLAPASGNLCAIGDPDQSIYGFRGADVGFFLRFHRDYPTAPTVQLTRNYRSTPVIVAGAGQAIAPETLVAERKLVAATPADADLPERIVVHAAASERAEAEFVAHSIERLLGGYSWLSIDSGRVGSGDGEAGAALSFADIAVLYRTEAQAAAIALAFDRAGVPFQQRSHERLLDRPGVRAIADRLRAGPDEGAGGSATVPALPLGGSVSDRLELVAREAAAAQELELEPSHAAAPGAGASAADIRAAADLLQPLAKRHGDDVEGFLADLALGAEVDSLDPRADRVSLLTLHAAKGLEFPVVFLVGCEDGLLPLRFGGAPANDAAEERRLFFVGMTRARTHLLLSWARRRRVRGESSAREPSPYLLDIEEALLEQRRGETRARRPAPEPDAGQLALL